MNSQCSKLASLLYEKNTRCPKSLVAIKKSLFVLLNATAEFVNCSVFLKNIEKYFCNLIYKKKKNFVKRIENLPHHLSKRFIGDNFSITDIAFKI